jgi:NAD(P)-dependent dehydrogenase (short-subunit alcohol dehydrogenase family)
MMQQKRFEQKKVIVTGGARGLGAAAARRFLQEGARVQIVDRDANALDQAIQEMSSLGDVYACVADVTLPEDVERIVVEAKTILGGIDVLINNAGIAPKEPFLEISEAHWDNVINVNLKGCFLVGQSIARVMVAQGRPAAIINTSSTNGLVGEISLAHYNASKGGVTLLTKSMALELAPYGIRVNAVCPGYIVTELSAANDSPTFIEEYIHHYIPLGRAGCPEDIAGVFAFLASDDAAFMTGATVVVDGGQLAF